MQSEIQKINSSIMSNTWSDAEINSILNAVKFARANLQRQVKNSLAVGSEVKWRSSKRGIVIHGTVSKIAQKYVTVKTMTDLWKVPANMLELA